jgi:hypothetical protein
MFLFDRQSMEEHENELLDYLLDRLRAKIVESS